MVDIFPGSPLGTPPADLRLILLGNIGCGKTTSVDTILGQLSYTSSSSSSRSCQVRQGFSEGRRVTLVEAPRWYWNGSDIEGSVREETKRALALAAPGPHAFLLLIPVGQFTEVDCCVPTELEEVFGEGVLGHTLVLLTCGDYLMGRTEEGYLLEEDTELRRVIGRCGGRYHFINNRRRLDREQVRALLEKVENMVEKNGGFYVRGTKLREMEERLKHREQRQSEMSRHRPEEDRAVVGTQRSGDGAQDTGYTSTLERRRGGEVEEQVTVRSGANRLRSAPVPETREDCSVQVNRSSSFRLNADGALLSQLSEVKPKEKQTTTFHHRINSFEERSSPEASPSSSFQSPISSSFASLSSNSFPSANTPSPSPNPTSLNPLSPSPNPTSLNPLSPSPKPPSLNPPSPPPPSSSSPELRLVLLGRSGAGKSAAGNCILGKEEFASRPDSLVAITQECEKKRDVVAGKRVAVIDTPDWFNSERSPEEVRAQISSCVALSSPGPHAFLLCVPLDQPAKTELQALGVLEAVFGPEAVRTHTLILFTFADRLRESGKGGDGGVEAYIASQRGDLLKLVERCGDRFHLLERGEGGGGGEERSVAELIEKVEQTVREGGGQCYSCPAFQEAEERVRQRQREIARERKRRKGDQGNQGEEGRPWPEKQTLHPSMQPLPEVDEEGVGEDEIEEVRDEAEKMVGAMRLETLPPISSSTLNPSLISYIRERVESLAKSMPQLLADGSARASAGAKAVSNSQVWGKVGTGAKGVQKVVADSAVWGKVRAGASGVAKPIIDSEMWEKIGAKKVHSLMVDGSTVVTSRAKMVAASPMWEQAGSGAKSGAKVLTDGSKWVGSGAKTLAQSPVWGKVGSGAKTGAKMVADRSVRVGAGLGAGAKKVAQSPVWGKVGSGAKAGAKRVAESPVWKEIAAGAKKLPMVVIAGALLGLVLGVFLAGVMGGAIGAATGSAVTEVVRRKLSKKSTVEVMDEGAKDMSDRVNAGLQPLKTGEKLFKAD